MISKDNTVKSNLLSVLQICSSCCDLYSVCSCSICVVAEEVLMTMLLAAFL